MYKHGQTHIDFQCAQTYWRIRAMPSPGTVVTAISAFVALILIANFFNWMLTLASRRRFVSRFGLVLAACLFIAFAAWMVVLQYGVVYAWGGNKASAVGIAGVFSLAGLACFWQVLAMARPQPE